MSLYRNEPVEWNSLHGGRTIYPRRIWEHHEAVNAREARKAPPLAMALR